MIARVAEISMTSGWRNEGNDRRRLVSQNLWMKTLLCCSVCAPESLGMTTISDVPTVHLIRCLHSLFVSYNETGLNIGNFVRHRKDIANNEGGLGIIGRKLMLVQLHGVNKRARSSASGQLSGRTLLVRGLPDLDVATISSA